MDSFIKFTDCMRKCMNEIMQNKGEGLPFYTHYNPKTHSFSGLKHNMIFSCPEGSPERKEPYNYMSRSKMMFGVIANIKDILKKEKMDDILIPYILYDFNTGDCNIYTMDKAKTIITKVHISYELLRNSTDNHSFISKGKIVENYDTFFNKIYSMLALIDVNKCRIKYLDKQIDTELEGGKE